MRAEKRAQSPGNLFWHAACSKRGVAKPFDIRQRTFLIACEMVGAFPARGALDPRSSRIWLQAVAAGTSVGAHLEEADAASSRAHFISLARGALREAREARYWLRIIATTRLRNHEHVPPLEAEADELVRILAAIVKRASRRRAEGE
jgi:four helix bundle protein